MLRFPDYGPRKLSEGFAAALQSRLCCCGYLFHEELDQRNDGRLPMSGFPEVNNMVVEKVDGKSSRLSREQLRQALVQLNQLVTRVDRYLYATLIRECGNCKALSEGKQVHAHMAGDRDDRNTFLGNLLVEMYGKCGSVKDARIIFDRLQQRNMYSWTLMIAAYAQNGYLQDGCRLFERMTQRDVVSWTAIITAHAQNGHYSEALKLYRRMVFEGYKPDTVTFASILDACGCLGALSEGKSIHATVVDCGFHTNLKVANALVTMYGKCGRLEDATSTFDKLAQRNVITWTALIAAYTQNGHPKDALELFHRMETEGIEGDELTFVSILDACAGLGSVEQGNVIHARITKSGFESDSVVMSGLVNMYARCGSLHNARAAFDKFHSPDVVLWTTMISTYARNGHGNEAMELSQTMDLDGVEPNHISFISILSACSHAGLLHNGLHYFISMSRDHGIEPCMDHYLCMIDLLGRSGLLSSAEELIHTMPFEPDVVAWRTILGSCRTHGDMVRGERVAQYVLKLDSGDCTPYVLLSNMHAG